MDKTSTNERTIFSAQHCAALSAAHVGKALSPEHRAAIAAGVKRQWQRRKQQETNDELSAERH